MPSILALNMRTALLSGSYTAVTFETALATATNAAAFTELANSYTSSEMLVNSTTAFPVIIGSSTARTISSNGQAFLRACANSGYATEQLVTTANGAALFGIVLRDNSGSRFRHWRDYTANYNRIKGFVNKSGSKLKSQVFTGSGTWSPTFPLQAMSIFSVGGGGRGSISSTGGNGGGGGEIKCVNVEQGSLPASNQTVTIGAGGATPSATTVGALSSAAVGGDAGTSTPGTGGGTTANGGYINFTDWKNPLTAAFQCFAGSQQGGTGGTRNTSTGSGLGNAGNDGLPGSAGNPSFDTPTTQATPGRAYGGGGGAAGGGMPSGSNTDASANTGGGGHGIDAASGTPSYGGSGIAVIYWLEA